jgi:hypothetical protein
MNIRINEFQTISGYLAPKPQKNPGSFDEVFADAVAAHLKEHANDGMSLFVFATRISVVDTVYIYPISTVNAPTALRITQVLHAERGLPASREWCLLFSYGDADPRDSLVQ